MRHDAKPYGAVAGILALLCLGVAALAQGGFAPQKPVRLIVPFAAGGAVDVLARVLSKSLGEQWHQNVVVENVPGANGNVAAEVAAKADPDGGTLFLGTNGTHATNASLYGHLNYDPIRDFVPIGLAVTIPHVLVVNPALPVHSVAELIAYAKQHAGELSYGSAGNGSSLHLAAELFDSMAAIQMVHVPYRGGAPAVTDLLAGRTQVMFAVVPLVLAQIRAGALRALAVTGAGRSPLLPEVPTVAESGLPGYEATAWIGVLAPAGAPPAVVEAVNAALNKTLAAPENRSLLQGQGFDVASGSPEQFRQFIAAETAKWGDVVRRSGATVQ